MKLVYVNTVAIIEECMQKAIHFYQTIFTTFNMYVSNTLKSRLNFKHSNKKAPHIYRTLLMTSKTHAQLQDSAANGFAFNFTFLQHAQSHLRQRATNRHKTPNIVDLNPAQIVTGDFFTGR